MMTRSITFSSVSALALLFAACSSEDSGNDASASGSGAGAAAGAGGTSAGGNASGGTGGTPLPRVSDQAAEEGRASCQFAAGALPHETLGESDPLGKDIPVEHILILMMENRSFDHYFSELPAYGVTDVDVAAADLANPDMAGDPLQRFHDDRYCVEDPDHGWPGSHDQYNDGAMDGFVWTSPGPAGVHAMGYFDQSDIPFYYELASTVAISDTYFCSLLGPTWPNRMYLYSGSSHSLAANSLPVSEVDNIFGTMNRAGISWKSYRDNLEPAAMFVSDYLESTTGCSFGEDPCSVVDVEKLFDDLQSGDLPEVAFINPELVTGINETSEHPPGNIQLGQHFMWRVVDALTKSPAWSKTALFITYDEHGGFYDHVPPPSACHPGTGEPSNPNDSARGDFDRLGFRVPVFVVSPYAKKSYVSHVVHDHTSILRFVQAKHNLPAFGGRDANAAAMMDFFDFENPPFMTPPTFTEPPIDADKRARCEAEFPGGRE